MDSSPPSILDLVRRAQAGDARALADLLASYRNYLRVLASACIHREVKGKADASDVVQETLIKAHENFPRFRGTTEQEWIAWLRQILLNSLSDLHRKYALAGRDVGRERSLEGLLDYSSWRLKNLLPADGSSPSQQAQRRETSVLLADALAELEPEDREVVLLRNLQELDWAEISARTGRSPDAARMLWTRALRRLGALVRSRLSSVGG
jgi:RNA polymerase sigma-70 factor (ECF subfamily)